MKKLISLIALIAIVISLFGCGKQAEIPEETRVEPVSESITSQNELDTSFSDNDEVFSTESVSESTTYQSKSDTFDNSENTTDGAKNEITVAEEKTSFSKKNTEPEKESSDKTATASKLKKGNLYKAECDGKIWAGILGKCYIVLRNIDSANEWGEKGQVYELHVTYVKTGEEYSMWSDGYWNLDETGTKLTLTPKNQSENGNIGVDEGKSKTFTSSNGVFTIPVTFEQGGKTTISLDINNSAL